MAQHMRIPVSLPSIHEMFPAHLMRPEDDYNSRHKYPKAIDSYHCQHCQSTRSRCSHSPVPPSGVLPQTYPYSHPENIVHTHSHDPRMLDVLHKSDARTRLGGQRKRSGSHIYSFDVLRSDPMNSSLQHLASSATLPTHTTNQQQQQSALPSTSSAFRVSVPPTTATSGIHVQNPVSIEGRSQRTAPDPAIPVMISFPVSRPASKPNQSTSEDASDDDNPGESAGKKHICPTCLKRFNRPSSLRIHVNTHTGATPFRCPWPNCGREFNVNSNMRRHYRNHTTPGFSRAQPNDNRRKRRRVDALDALSHPVPAVDQTYRKPHPANLIPSPPISHFSASDDSEYDSDMEAESYSIQERDELVDYRSSTANLTQSMAKVAVASVKQPQQQQQHGLSSSPYARYHHQRQQQQQHPYGDAPHSRPLTPGSSFHSSSSSNSPSPRLPPAAHNNGRHYSYSEVQTSNKKEHKYNPSAPYIHSLADTRVSTALRPAFHS